MKTVPQECPIEKVANVLCDTWTMLIMHNVIEGTKGFCELERALNGISTRTLTLKLKKLAADGMITKRADGQYTATNKGQGLRLVESAMKRYQKKYL